MITKKILSRAVLGLVFAAGCLGAGNALAAPNQQAEIRELRRQIEALRQQNEALSRRLERMERGMADQNVRILAQERKIEEQAGTASKFEEALEKIGDRVSIHGSIDADLRFSGDYGGNHASEFAIDSVEVELGVEPAEWARALALFKYEEREVFVDEAYLTLGGTGNFPVFLKAGKMVVPFGDFSTHMLYDPRTQEVGEINDGAAVIGWSGSGFTASVFAFNGLDEAGGDPVINGVGAAVSYDHAGEDGLAFSVGAGIVNNLVSSGVSDISDALLHDTVAGLDLHAGVGYAGFAATAEYLTALDDYDARDLEFRGTGARTAALHTELAYTMDIAGHETVFALAFQKTWETVGMNLPEFHYSVGVAMGLVDGLTLALAGYIDQDYDKADGGSGDDGCGVAGRLSYEF